MDSSAIEQELAFVIRHGAGMLDDVEDVIRRCCTDPNPSRDLAKSLGTLISGYLALRGRLAELPQTTLACRVDRLLGYGMELTRQASMLAFRPHDAHWDALAAGFRGGRLGEPAKELRGLAAAVVVGGTASRTGGG